MQALAHLEQALVARAPRRATIAAATGHHAALDEALPRCDRGRRRRHPAGTDERRGTSKGRRWASSGWATSTGARRTIAERPPEVEAADLVMNFGLYWDLMWVLDAEQQKLLLSLPAEAFGGDAPSRALVFRADPRAQRQHGEVRRYAEEARRGFAVQSAQNLGNEQLVIAHGLALAYLGRREEAIREGSTRSSWCQSRAMPTAAGTPCTRWSAST